MLKIVVWDDCGNDDGIWIFPGTKKELINEWNLFRFPFMRPSLHYPLIQKGKFVHRLTLSASEFNEMCEQEDAVYVHNNHHSIGDHVFTFEIDEENFSISKIKINKIFRKMYPEIWEKYLSRYSKKR